MYLLVSCFSRNIFGQPSWSPQWQVKLSEDLLALSYPVTSDKHILPLKSWKVWSNIRNSLSLNLIKFAQQLKAAAVESFCLQNAQLAVLSEPGFPCPPPQILADQSTLYLNKGGGQIMPTTIVLGTPSFSDPPTGLPLWKEKPIEAKQLASRWMNQLSSNALSSDLVRS